MLRPGNIPACFLAFGLAACHPPVEHEAQAGQTIPGRKSKLTVQQINGLDSLSLDFQFRGFCEAYSNQKNARPSNGEYHSDNLPKMVDQWFPRAGLYLTVNEAELTAFNDGILGCKLYLVNTTDSLVELQATDSRLNILAEALDESNLWKPISYLPGSNCGNSYHKVSLDTDEYWEFDVPVFKGPFRTKLRYSLVHNGRQFKSNAIAMSLNKKQFNSERKEGHNPENIMDPYNE